MTCQDLEALVEPLVAGDLKDDPAVAAHLAGCERCARMVALARQVDSALRQLPAVTAPRGFTGMVMARVRRERWRAEQFLDLGFNLAMAGGVGLVVGGVYLLLNLSGLAAVTADTSELVTAGLAVVVDRVSAALPTYLVAAALLGTALGAWWWAERRLTT